LIVEIHNPAFDFINQDRQMAKNKAKQRVYLNDEEKKVLASLLDEWNGKPDKKTCDSFISSEVLPKIQQLNMLRYGPEVISRDKEAKMVWEGRVQVRLPTKLLFLASYQIFRRYILGLKTTSPTKTDLYSSWKGRFPYDES
jgi:hypothetical protein